MFSVIIVLKDGIIGVAHGLSKDEAWTMLEEYGDEVMKFELITEGE